MMLGRWFALHEFTVSKTAARLGIPVEPPPDDVERLRRLVAVVLDPLRTDLGCPLAVSGGWRPRELNGAIPGSAAASEHMTGNAADVRPPAGWTSRTLARRCIDLGLPFDQLIWYDAARGGHLHVGLYLTTSRGEIQRGQVLRAPAGGGFLSRQP